MLLCMFDLGSQYRVARSINGEIVSDSDSSLDCEQKDSVKELITKKSKA